MNRRSRFTLITAAIAWLLIVLPASVFAAPPAEDLEGVKAASRAFYAALSVLDSGEAMGKVWAHRPYVTFVGPRSKSIMVGWEAQKKYWAEANKSFQQRDVMLSDQQIHVNGNLAWEMGLETGDIKTKSGGTRKTDLIVTNVYEKIDGRWLTVSHHTQPKPQ